MLCIVFPVTRYFNLPNDHTFPGGAVVKNPPASAGDAGIMGSIPGSERSPGGGSSNPLQYSYLENPMDRGAWQATVHGVDSHTRRNSPSSPVWAYIEGL